MRVHKKIRKSNSNHDSLGRFTFGVKLSPDTGGSSGGCSSPKMKKINVVTFKNDKTIVTKMNLPLDLAKRYEDGEFTYRSDTKGLVSQTDFRMDCARKQKPIKTSKIKPIPIAKKKSLYTQSIKLFTDVMNEITVITLLVLQSQISMLLYSLR